MGEPRKRLVRGLGWVALLIALALVLTAAGVRQAGAWAIVKAPNFGAAAQPQTPPGDVSGVVRAEVGPPTAILEAWILDPLGAPRGTVLVLHGIRDQKASMIGVGRALRDRGLRAILVDLRGHGGSSGRFLTYGVVESRDLSQLLDQLDALGMIDGPLGVYGASYGGAVALQLSAIDRRVRAVASVSTFASLRAVVPPYVRRNVPAIGEFVPSLAIEAVIDRAGELAAFSPDDADTREAIAHTHADVLLVHGEEDEHIPFEQARALLSACPRGRCRLVPIPGTDHPGALASPDAMFAAVDFLAQHAAASLAMGP